MRSILLIFIAPLIAFGQITFGSVQTTPTQAILQYTASASSTLQVADMNRGIVFLSGTQAAGTVTITTRAAHGLLTGAVVWIENSGVAAWNGWQTLTGIPAANQFTFASATAGSATGGDAGVLIDDLNPTLYPGSNLDTRAGNIGGQGRSKAWVIGQRTASVASDSNRYTRALQTNSRHHYTITSGAATFDGEFTTKNLPLGDTHNEGPPTDPQTPNAYAYPTQQPGNQAQTLLDPKTGTRTIATASTYEDTGAAGSSNGPVITVSGIPGRLAFIGYDLFWISSDGSIMNDLGYPGLYNAEGGKYSDLWHCGQAMWTPGGTFDPVVSNTWYCFVGLYFDFDRYTVIKATLNPGTYAPVTPGTKIASCVLNGDAPPCVLYTVMQPNKPQSLYYAAQTFSPGFSAAVAAGYPDANWALSMSPDSELIACLNQNQNTPAWCFVYALGDRTPAGTDANSLHIIAGASTYSTAPASWCVDHTIQQAFGGWLQIVSEESFGGAFAAQAQTTLTSAALNVNPGVPGGLNTCPTNPFGITGQHCTAITTSGEPTWQPTQVGDLIVIDSEWMRELVKPSANSLVVQRGYASTAAAHGGATLLMGCGVHFQPGADEIYWNYRADPYGTNATGATLPIDQNYANAHIWTSATTTLNAGGSSSNLTDCPTLPITVSGATFAQCYMARHGSSGSAVIASPIVSQSLNVPFANVMGSGGPNQVDSHPGFCTSTWCLDGRPENGGTYGTVGSAGTPFTNVAGQLWKFAAASSILNRKFLATMAYVGSAPLLDISGLGSLIPTDASGSYEYCYTAQADECRAGSVPGNLYVNVPTVDNAYCPAPAIAVPPTAHSICVGDMGSYVSQLTQVGIASHDLFGAYSRSLGTLGKQWQGQDVFWTPRATPNGAVVFNAGYSSDLATIVPPFPNADSVNRGTFRPVNLRIPGVAGATTAMVEFGYAEFGAPTSLNCTSRREPCVMATPLGQPFYWESETVAGGGGVPLVSCASGCTFSIPALPDHVLYYRPVYFNGSTRVLNGPLSVVAR